MIETRQRKYPHPLGEFLKLSPQEKCDFFRLLFLIGLFFEERSPFTNVSSPLLAEDTFYGSPNLRNSSPCRGSTTFSRFGDQCSGWDPAAPLCRTRGGLVLIVARGVLLLFPPLFPDFIGTFPTNKTSDGWYFFFFYSLTP